MIRLKEGKETAKKYVGEEHSRQRETALNTGPEAMRMSAQPGGQCDGAEPGEGRGYRRQRSNGGARTCRVFWDIVTTSDLLHKKWRITVRFEAKK